MMRLSIFPGVTTTRGREIDTDWAQFATTYLQHHIPQLTKDGELYAGAVYASGNIERCDANVIGRTAVVLDVDNKDCRISTPEDFNDNLTGLTWAWHSTFSSTPAHPKFRIVLPLDRMVSPEEWPAVYRGVIALVGNDPAIDDSSADLSRAYYRPAYHPSNKGQEFAGYVEGEHLCADEMIELGGGYANVVSFRQPVQHPPTVPTRRFDGRNDALKAQVAACMAKGKGVDDTVREVMAYDAQHHTPGLFWDPAENKGSVDPYANALRFVSSIVGSVNTRRVAKGLPAEVPGGSLGEPVTELPALWWADRSMTLDTHDFVEGILNDGTMSVIYGDSNVGKSFWMLDLALHVALGRPWQGRQVELGGVIYVAAEGGFLFQNRLEAFARHYGIKDSDVPFALVPCGVDLRSPRADTDRLIELVNHSASLIQMPVRLVVIDTLARAMNGGNENSSEDMGSLVINADRVRAATGSHLAFIHHCGKDAAKGARGHSSLRAATDTEIEIIKENGVMKVSAVKQRDMEMGEVMDFTLKSIELGTNRRGKAVTSCVILKAATFGIAPNMNGLGKVQAQALRVLEDMYSDAQAEMGERNRDPGDAEIELSRFQSELADLGLLGKNEKYHKQRFYKIKEDLLERNAIYISVGIVRLLVKRGSQTGSQTGPDGSE